MMAASFWHGGLCVDEFHGGELPSRVDIVVVGGGLSGVSLLYWLTKLFGSSKRILLLERKHLAAGATGRNGGHLRPINDHETMCAAEIIKTLRDHQLEEETELFLHSEAPLAAQIHPAKLVLALANVSLRTKGTTILTNTRVLNIKKNLAAPDQILVNTSRGAVTCSFVSICTNAYAADIIPSLRGSIIPTRGQCIVTQPLSADTPLIFQTNSTFTDPDGSSLYIIQRHLDRRVVAGGFRRKVLGAESGLTNDDEVNPEISKFLSKWIDSDDRIIKGGNKLKVEAEWTGIMGFTPDSKPLVGPLDEEAGIYISAGFNGHGMPVCFWASKAIALMIKNHKNPNPSSFLPPELADFISEWSPTRKISTPTSKL